MRKFLSWLAVELLLVALIVGVWFGLNETKSFTDVSAGGSAALGLVLLDSENGVYVLAVSDKSPAHHAGLQPGDVILTAGEMPLEEPSTLDQLVNKAEKNLLLTVQREKQVVKLTLPCR